MTAIWNNPAAPSGPGQPGQPQQGDVGQRQSAGPEGQGRERAENVQVQDAPPAEAEAEAEVEVGAEAEVTAEAEVAGEAAGGDAEQPDSEPVESAEAAAGAESAADTESAVATAADADAAEAEARTDQPAEPEAASVQGQIEIADEVVEKVAALAALEVDGVVDLGGDVTRLLENVRERIGVGKKRGDQGVRASITGDEATINLTIVVEYGHVVMDVARNVQANVATQAHKMLGLRIAAVNVKVDDVQLPQATSVGRRRDNSAVTGEGAAE